MVNIIMIDDNLYFSKKLINKILETNYNARLYNLENNGKRAWDKLVKNIEDIDIILLDLKLPGYNGLEILEMINKNEIFKYEQSIIIISGDYSMLTKIKDNPFVYSYIEKGEGFEMILKKITSLIEIKEKENETLEIKIHKELQKLSYNKRFIGTKYLEEVILLIAKTPENIKNFEKQIYPILAKKYNTNTHAVKCNILTASDNMYFDCPNSIIMKYFGFKIDYKPRTKEIVSAILENIINH